MTNDEKEVMRGCWKAYLMIQSKDADQVVSIQYERGFRDALDFARDKSAKDLDARDAVAAEREACALACGKPSDRKQIRGSWVQGRYPREGRTMTPPPELKPCPFCGHTTAPEEMRIGTCFVRCTKIRGGCGADGPTTDTTLAAAAKLWNLRAGDEK